MRAMLEKLPLVFESPYWLWLLLLVPVLLILKGRAGQSSAVQFPSIGLVAGIAGRDRTFWGGIPGLLFLLKIAAFALLILALGRPKWRKDTIAEQERSGVDIVLALDLSGSMWAHDFKKNGKAVDRLTVVRGVIRDFIQARKDDRIGIVAFSGAPYLVSPLTLNHDWVMENLERLRIGSIPEQGTAIGSAIGMAVNRLNNQKSKSRLIVLLTDGANNQGQIEPTQAAEAASSFGIKIYAVGAGEKGVVDFPHFNRDGSLRRSPSGKVLLGKAKSDIDLETLAKVADLTGGKSFHAKNAKALSRIYKEIDQLEKTEKKLNIRYNYRDIYTWPLLLGLGIFLLEQTLVNTRFRKLP